MATLGQAITSFMAIIVILAIMASTNIAKNIGQYWCLYEEQVRLGVRWCLLLEMLCCQKPAFKWGGLFVFYQRQSGLDLMFLWINQASRL